MRDLTIGITITLRDSKENIWNNGISQNAINLALLLSNSLNNYNVILLSLNDNKLEYDIEGIKICNIKEKIDELDIIVILGTQISDDSYNYLKNKDCKIIHYSCGTNYILDMENILFKPDTDSKFYKHTPDQIWVIPQNYKTNKYYFQTLYRRKTIEVPFIWSPIFVDYVNKNYNLKGTYIPSNEPKRISCFEPNMNVVKFTMYNILIVEEVYRERPELIKHFYVTNSDSIKTNPLFIDLMRELNIVKDGVATFESRFRMPYFLDTYTDIVVSHQWENPLNYAYLEALYMNFPLVHNAHMIKDGGYYYDEFNVEEGKKQLLYAILEHDKYLDEYKEKNKKVLDRYLPTNEQSIKIYDELIDDLYKK